MASKTSDTTVVKMSAVNLNVRVSEVCGPHVL